MPALLPTRQGVKRESVEGSKLRRILFMIVVIQICQNSWRKMEAFLFLTCLV